MRAPLLLCLLALAPLGAQAQSCSPLRLDFVIDQRPTRNDQTHSYVELNAYSPAAAAQAANSRSGPARSRDSLYRTRVLGLYSSNSSVSAASRFQFTPLPNGSVSVCLSSVALTYRSEPVIYLAREIPAGCGLDSVYQHELGHLSIDYTVASRARPILAAWGPQIPNHFFSANSAAANAQAQSMVDAILSRVSDHIFHSQEARQAEHDSPHEYARVQRSCGGSLGAI